MVLTSLTLRPAHEGDNLTLSLVHGDKNLTLKLAHAGVKPKT